jgi:hypothetical protein
MENDNNLGLDAIFDGGEPLDENTAHVSGGNVVTTNCTSVLYSIPHLVERTSYHHSRGQDLTSVPIVDHTDKRQPFGIE